MSLTRLRVIAGGQRSSSVSPRVKLSSVVRLLERSSGHELSLKEVLEAANAPRTA